MARALWSQRRAHKASLHKEANPGILRESERGNFMQALNEDGKKAKVEKWADISDPNQLDKTLLEFPLEVKTQIFELQRLRQILNIQKARAIALQQYLINRIDRIDK